MLRKKIVVLFLLLGLLMSPVTEAFSAPNGGQDAKSNAENQLKQNENDYKTAQDKVTQLESDIQKLDSQIEKTLRELEENKTNVAKSEEEVKKAEKEVEKAIDEIRAQQKLLDNRVRVLYKSGVTGYLELIINSESFNDLVDKFQIVSRMVKYDKQIVEQMEEKRDNLEIKKATLEAENAKLLQLKKEKEQKLSKLSESKKEQTALIEEAKKQERLLGEKVQVSKNEVQKLQQILNMIAIATNEGKSLKEIQNAVNYLQGLNSNESYIQEAVNRGKQIISDKQKPPTNGGNNGGNNGGGKPSPGDGVPSANAMKVVLYSMQFQGVPYVWGGETPAGFDCSGFVRYCYAKAAGVYLTRTTYTQINEGRAVDRSQLKPGDLVFFGTPADPNHVGLYIGNGNYIHAPRTGDFVKISSLQGKNYLTARRIIP